MSSWNFWHKGKAFSDGDSEEYHEEQLLRPRIKQRIELFELGYQRSLDTMFILPVKHETRSMRKPDPVQEISRLANIKKETAQNIFNEIEKDIDQICKEERVEPLNSDEKEELVLGIVRAMSNLGKRVSKKLE